MKTIPLDLPRERWKKNFDKAVLPDSLARRFVLGDQDETLGKRTEEVFYFFEKKKARFAMLSPVLKGKIVRTAREGVFLRFRFTRLAVPCAVFFVWGLLMMVTGGIFFTEDKMMAFGFFLPGILGILPYLCYTQKRKQKLLTLLGQILETDLSGKKEEKRGAQ